MTERPEAISSRGRLLEAVRKELVEFERRENEFRKQDREERAAELRLPVFKNSLSRGRLSWRPREVSEPVRGWRNWLMCLLAQSRPNVKPDIPDRPLGANSGHSGGAAVVASRRTPIGSWWRTAEPSQGGGHSR